MELEGEFFHLTDQMENKPTKKGEEKRISFYNQIGGGKKQ